jgi:CRISPR/Cas system Type II protein with McrA/HNH and RuvC-like nuclease domain
MEHMDENIIAELSRTGLSGKRGEPGDPKNVEIWVRDKFKCVYCGEKLLKDVIRMYSAQIDHILPQSRHKDYKNLPANRVLTCYCCNHMKGKYDPIEKLSDEDRMALSPKTFEVFRSKLLKACKDHLDPRLKDKEAVLNKSNVIINPKNAFTIHAPIA